MNFAKRYSLGEKKDTSIDESERLIIETKGREDVDVEHKDKRMKKWCKDAMGLSGSKWSFIRVDQGEFEKYRFKSVKELTSALKG